MSLRPDQAAVAAQLLPQLSIFSGVSTAQYGALEACLDFRAMPSGKVVILDQEISKTLYFLAKGSVGIWRRVNNQKDRVALLKAPDFFGEVSMFSDSPASALVKTEEDSQFFMLSREKFDALVQNDASFGDQIHRNIETLKSQRPRIQKPVPENPA